MKIRPVLLISLLAVLFAGRAGAQPLPPKSELCIACHSVDGKQRTMGPAFKAVATKYAGRADAAELLVQKVRKGTTGVAPGTPQWGNIPMPAVTQLSEAEARALVKWVLSQQ
ncbi:MAG TPA: c-type cytochrome [Sphingomicrobium sp.]|nr:c-type cytochrome [Sphingomicrobium sp.]